MFILWSTGIAHSLNQWQWSVLSPCYYHSPGQVNGGSPVSSFSVLTQNKTNWRKKEGFCLPSVSSAVPEKIFPFLGKSDQKKDPDWEIPLKIFLWKHSGLVLGSTVNWEIYENQRLIWCRTWYYFCSAFASDFPLGAREMLTGVSEGKKSKLEDSQGFL